MKPYGKPDVKGPRFQKHSKRTLNKEFYSRFRERQPNLAYLTDHEIKKIVQTFGTTFCKVVMRERDGAELPEQMGQIFIGSCPKKLNSNPNIPLSIEHEQEIQNQNYESNRWLQKIFYTNWGTTYRFKNHHLWHMNQQMHRDFKRTAAKNYPKEYKKYRIVDNMKWITKLYKSRSYKQFMTEQAKTIDFKEFDI